MPTLLGFLVLDPGSLDHSLISLNIFTEVIGVYECKGAIPKYELEMTVGSTGQARAPSHDMPILTVRHKRDRVPAISALEGLRPGIHHSGTLGGTGKT